MPVLTRNMRKNADFPALSARFPVDVPNTRAQPGSSKSARARSTRPLTVTRSSSLILPPPVVLSSPTCFDPPSPLTPSDASFASQQQHLRSSRSSSRSSFSSFSSTTTCAPHLAEMHPGVARTQRKQPPAGVKWNLEEHHESVRMGLYAPLPRPGDPRRPEEPSFKREWSVLSDQTPPGAGSRAGSVARSEDTVHGTPSLSSKPSTPGVSGRQLRSRR